MKKYLEICKITNTHGIKGDVKAELWCDGIEILSRIKTLYFDAKGENPVDVISVRQQKNAALIKLAKIDSIEQAEKLKGKVLYCNRDDVEIDENAHFIADIIGCIVIDSETKKEYGKIVDVANYGSCDIYDTLSGGRHILIPNTPDIVKEIDIERREVKIKPMKGLFDEN